MAMWRTAQWLSTESPLLLLEEPDHGLMECRLVWRGVVVAFERCGPCGWHHAEKALRLLIRDVRSAVDWKAPIDAAGEIFDRFKVAGIAARAVLTPAKEARSGKGLTRSLKVFANPGGGPAERFDGGRGS